jgi:hypothetical protein
MADAFCGYGMSYSDANNLIVGEEYAGFGFDPGSHEYGATCWMMEHLPGRTGKEIRLPGW